jgi:hypothetical protein
MTNKKVTLASVKSFIKKNSNNLFIKTESTFDGMVDGVVYNHLSNYSKVELNNESINNKYTLGINGAWFVGSSRDYFKSYEANNMICISVSNCCGSFTLATTK